MEIFLIQNQDIDKKKYDTCIENSLQGTVYALSWYLDVVSPGWKLLATPDYSFVMPVPCDKKYGISYSMQPSFCQQLGIFSEQPVDSGIVKYFLRKIPSSYYDLQFNSGNSHGSPEVSLRKNYILNLNRTYETIQASYKSSCRGHVRKAGKYGLSVVDSTDKEVYLDFLSSHSHNRPIRRMMPLFESLMEVSGKHTRTEIWHVKDEQGTLMSAAFFIFWNHRIYYMVSVSSPEGKRKQGMSLLIDSFIQAHSNTEKILDFEGSVIPEIAGFFEGFGAVPEFYPQVVKKGFWFFVRSVVKKIR